MSEYKKLQNFLKVLQLTICLCRDCFIRIIYKFLRTGIFFTAFVHPEKGHAQKQQARCEEGNVPDIQEYGKIWGIL